MLHYCQGRQVAKDPLPLPTLPYPCKPLEKGKKRKQISKRNCKSRKSNGNIDVSWSLGQPSDKPQKQARDRHREGDR